MTLLRGVWRHHPLRQIGDAQLFADASNKTQMENLRNKKEDKSILKHHPSMKNPLFIKFSYICGMPAVTLLEQNNGTGYSTWHVSCPGVFTHNRPFESSFMEMPPQIFVCGRILEAASPQFE